MAIYWLEQTESDLPSENTWLSSCEMEQLGRMLFLKRRSDWRLGRWTAKNSAAAFLGLPRDLIALSTIEVQAATCGAPEVFLHQQPAPISISLSHRGGLALCTVSDTDSNFGCDLELVEPRNASFVNDYFTDDEALLIHKIRPEKRDALSTLFWSAKESALKALRVGLRVDTRNLCVRIAGTDGKRNHVGDPIPLASTLPQHPCWLPLCVSYDGKSFQGCWRMRQKLIRTVVHSDIGSNQNKKAT